MVKLHQNDYREDKESGWDVATKSIAQNFGGKNKQEAVISNWWDFRVTKNKNICWLNPPHGRSLELDLYLVTMTTNRCFTKSIHATEQFLRNYSHSQSKHAVSTQRRNLLTMWRGFWGRYTHQSSWSWIATVPQSFYNKRTEASS